MGATLLEIFVYQWLMFDVALILLKNAWWNIGGIRWRNFRWRYHSLEWVINLGWLWYFIKGMVCLFTDEVWTVQKLRCWNAVKILRCDRFSNLNLFLVRVYLRIECLLILNWKANCTHIWKSHAHVLLNALGFL